nr:glycosyltransferase family 4 protein [uncultured Bacteroides sp.]
MIKKNILVVSNSPFFGGGEQFIVEILSNVQNSFFLVRNEKLYDALNTEKKRLFSYSTNNVKKEEFSEIKNAIQKWNIDIVILNGGSTIYYSPFLKNVKIIIYRHTTNLYVSNFIKRLLYVILLHICYIFAQKIIHVSDYSRNEQMLFKRKSYTVHNGLRQLDYSISKIKHNPLRLLFLSRVTESKGIKDIVEIVSKFPPNEVILDIVGDGNLSNWVKNKTNEQIHFYGFQKDVSSFYKNSDVFILLSHYENCPLSIIDAMKYGLPILATAVGGIPELVKNGYNGFLVSERQELEEKIYELIKNEKFYATLSANAIKTFKTSFSSERVIDNVQRIVNSI